MITNHCIRKIILTVVNLPLSQSIFYDIFAIKLIYFTSRLILYEVVIQNDMKIFVILTNLIKILTLRVYAHKKLF